MAYSWYNPNESVVNAQKKKEEVQAQQPGAYTPSAAVTNAQNKVQNLEANKPGEYTPTAREQAADAQLQSALNSKPGAYTPSESVQAAQSALNSVLASKPQNFQSKYGEALNNILLQIQNPKEFKYEFNGDNLFKAYADLYTQNGRQASMNAMGQAAALTGGYGNSYAQQVGNQAYDEYLRALYDKGLELHDRAYQKYADQRADLYNQYGAISDADKTDYNRYRDTVGDWKDDRAFYADRYDTERNFDYGKYRDDKGDWYKDVDLYTDLYRDERNTGYERHRDNVSDWYKDYENANNAYKYEDEKDYTQHRDNVSDWKDLLSYYTDEANNERDFDYGAYTDMLEFDEGVRQFNAELDEKIRQFNESLDWEKMSEQQKYAAQYVMSILANGQMPSEELLRQAGLSAEDAAKMMAVLVTGGTGGPGKKTTGDTGSNVEPMTYGEAATYVLQNTPLNTPLSSITGNKNDTRTLQDLSKKGSIDVTRVGKNSNLTDAQKTQAVKNAVEAINNGAAYHNSATDFANKTDKRPDEQKLFRDTSINDLAKYKKNKLLPKK